MIGRPDLRSDAAPAARPALPAPSAQSRDLAAARELAICAATAVVL